MRTSQLLSKEHNRLGRGELPPRHSRWRQGRRRRQRRAHLTAATAAGARIGDEQHRLFVKGGRGRSRHGREGGGAKTRRNSAREICLCPSSSAAMRSNSASSLREGQQPHDMYIVGVFWILLANVRRSRMHSLSSFKNLEFHSGTNKTENETKNVQEEGRDISLRHSERAATREIQPPWEVIFVILNKYIQWTEI